jgi:hypothetical protein
MGLSVKRSAGNNPAYLPLSGVPNDYDSLIEALKYLNFCFVFLIWV